MFVFQTLNSIFLFIIGAAVGSFLNVLIDRWSNDQSITGRSRCDHCKKQLEPLDLIPIISFIFLHGRSRCCKKKLSWQYPLVELVTGIFFVLIFNFKFSIFNQFSISNFQFLNNWDLIDHWLLIIGSLGIISCLIVVFFADVKYQIIPDQIQILFFLFSIFYFLFSSYQSTQSLLLQLLSGVIVLLPILIIYLITRGRGMGFGDVKLAFNMGVLLGIKGGLLALYFAFILGGIFGAYLLLSKKKKLKSKIPFGPFLVVGCILMLFFSDKIWQVISSIYYF